MQKGQEPPGCSWTVLLGFRGLPLLSKYSAEPHSSLSQQPRLVDCSLVLSCPSVHTASFPSHPRSLPAQGSFTEFSARHTWGTRSPEVCRTWTLPSSIGEFSTDGGGGLTHQHFLSLGLCVWKLCLPILPQCLHQFNHSPPCSLKKHAFTLPHFTIDNVWLRLVTSKKVTVLSILPRKMLRLQVIDPCGGSQPVAAVRCTASAIIQGLCSQLCCKLSTLGWHSLPLYWRLLKDRGWLLSYLAFLDVAPQHCMLADPMTDNPPPAPDSFLEEGILWLYLGSESSFVQDIPSWISVGAHADTLAERLLCCRQWRRSDDGHSHLLGRQAMKMLAGLRQIERMGETWTPGGVVEAEGASRGFRTQ